MLYENVFIGAFVYGLGYRTAIQDLEQGRGRTPVSVNLYQQTPRDATTGDLMTTLRGRSSLIEFKRVDAEELDDEIEKCIQLSKALQQHEKVHQEPVIELSREAHFLGVCGTKQDGPGKGTRIDFVTYLSLADGGKSFSPTSLDDFVRGMLNGSVGVGPDRFKAYLKFLLMFGTRKSSSSGVIINIDNDGSIRLYRQDSLDRLLKLELDLEVELAVQPKQVPQQDIEYDGPSL